MRKWSRGPSAPLRLEEVSQLSKGSVGGGFFFFHTALDPVRRYVIQIAAVFVVVAIEAKVFPVAPVMRVMVVVVILVVNGEHVKVLPGKLSATTGTYPGMDSQRLLAVAFIPFRLCLPGLGSKPFQPLGVN